MSGYLIPTSIQEANEWLKRTGESKRGFYFKQDEIGKYHIKKYGTTYGTSEYLFDLVNTAADYIPLKRDWKRSADFINQLQDNNMKLIYELTDDFY